MPNPLQRPYRRQLATTPLLRPYVASLQQLTLVPKLLCRIFGQILTKFYRIHSADSLSSQNFYVAFSDRFSPNSIASNLATCRQRPFGQVIQ